MKVFCGIARDGKGTEHQEIPWNPTQIPVNPCPSHVLTKGMARVQQGLSGISQGLKSPIVTKYLN